MADISDAFSHLFVAAVSVMITHMLTKQRTLSDENKRQICACAQHVVELIRDTADHAVRYYTDDPGASNRQSNEALLLSNLKRIRQDFAKLGRLCEGLSGLYISELDKFDTAISDDPFGTQFEPLSGNSARLETIREAEASLVKVIEDKRAE